MKFKEIGTEYYVNTRTWVGENKNKSKIIGAIIGVAVIIAVVLLYDNQV